MKYLILHAKTLKKRINMIESEGLNNQICALSIEQVMLNTPVVNRTIHTVY